jgi:hypothetical protein
MTDTVKTITLLCGFVVIFAGVYLVNFSSNIADGHGVSGERSPNDSVTSGPGFFRPRLSSADSRRTSEETQVDDDRKGLMHSYEVESEGVELQRYN